MSEPATLTDLGHSIHHLYCTASQHSIFGRSLPQFRMEQLIQGLLHVDDSLVFSCVFCSTCLKNAVKRIFPADVGMTEEGDSSVDASIQFLQTEISVVGDYLYTVKPFNVNRPWIQREESTQRSPDYPTSHFHLMFFPDFICSTSSFRRSLLTIR